MSVNRNRLALIDNIVLVRQRRSVHGPRLGRVGFPCTARASTGTNRINIRETAITCCRCNSSRCAGPQIMSSTDGYGVGNCEASDSKCGPTLILHLVRNISHPARPCAGTPGSERAEIGQTIFKSVSKLLILRAYPRVEECSGCTILCAWQVGVSNRTGLPRNKSRCRRRE
jgi:hypothetical protein